MFSSSKLGSLLTVLLLIALVLGACGGGESCSSCPQDCGPCGGSGDCCAVQAGPGCGEAGIQACVCAQDNYCCQTEWDQLCADEVVTFACGVCGP